MKSFSHYIGILIAIMTIIGTISCSHKSHIHKERIVVKDYTTTRHPDRINISIKDHPAYSPLWLQGENSINIEQG